MQKTGRVTLKINGDVYASLPGASIQIGGSELEDGMTDQVQHWHSEKIVPSEIKATLVHVADLDLPTLRATRNAVATFETDTGVTYSVRGAVVKMLGELQNGEVEVTVGGPPATQV